MQDGVRNLKIYYFLHDGVYDATGEISQIQYDMLMQREAFQDSVYWLMPFSETEKGRFLVHFSSLGGKISEKYLENNYWNSKNSPNQ